MHKRLTITHRLIAACLVISLPLVAITVFLIVTSINKDIDFGRWEKMGNHYQRPLERLLELLPEHAALSQRSAADGSVEPQRAAIAAQIDNAFSELARVQSDLGDKLQFTIAGLEQRKRGHVLPSNVAKEWRELVSSPGR